MWDLSSLDVTSTADALRLLGAALGMGLGAIGPGVGEGYAAELTCEAVARQPKSTGDVTKTMLIGQAVSESSGVFALVVSIVLLFAGTKDLTLARGIAYLSAGICIGLGAIGPGIGMGLAAGNACAVIGRAPFLQTKILFFMLIGQSVASSPGILALLVSIILMFTDLGGMGIVGMAAIMGAGLSMGFGSFGPGLGCGFAAADAVTGVGHVPEKSGTIMQVMLVGQAVSQSTAIYSMVIAFCLIYLT